MLNASVMPIPFIEWREVILAHYFTDTTIKDAFCIYDLVVGLAVFYYQISDLVCVSDKRLAECPCTAFANADCLPMRFHHLEVLCIRFKIQRQAIQLRRCVHSAIA